MELTFENVHKTYSGKPGCMCGCNGEYRDTDRAKKMALTRMLNRPDYKLNLWDSDDDVMGCLYHETETRNNVVYIKKGVRLPDEVMAHLTEV